MTYIFFFLIAIVIFIVNNFLIKKNFLPSHSGEKHQKFVEKKNIQLSGGIYAKLACLVTQYLLFFLFLFFLIILNR